MPYQRTVFGTGGGLSGDPGMRVLVGAVLLILGGAAVVGAGAGYAFGGKHRGLTAVGGAVAGPVLYLMFAKWRTGVRGQQLKSCIDTYCAQNPTDCTRDSTGQNYVMGQGQRRVDGSLSTGAGQVQCFHH